MAPSVRVGSLTLTLAMQVIKETAVVCGLQSAGWATLHQLATRVVHAPCKRSSASQVVASKFWILRMRAARCKKAANAALD